MARLRNKAEPTIPPSPGGLYVSSRTVDRIMLLFIMVLFIGSHTIDLKSYTTVNTVVHQPGNITQEITSTTSASATSPLHGTGTGGTSTTSFSQQPQQSSTTGQQGSGSTTFGKDLPTCRAIMSAPNSPYRDGAFLTRHSNPVYWVPRVDGSRELRHSMCTLHRYTSSEARQCLANHHVSFIGDSLTRYQFMSLAYFIHHGKYPPRFALAPKDAPCPFKDENGVAQCSPPGHPNICKEGDWRTITPRGKDPWTHFMQAMGSYLFDGYMEANGYRDFQTRAEQMAENYLYVAPPLPGDANNQQDITSSTTTTATTTTNNRPMLSYAQEVGWNPNPTPIKGFNFTGCAYKGTCHFTNALAEERRPRSLNKRFDFEQDIILALQPNGALRRQLPPVDVAIYNRGYWGVMTRQRAQDVMAELFDFSQREGGRCFFKASTGGFERTLEAERGGTKAVPNGVRGITWDNGCGYLDFAHITNDFNSIHYKRNTQPPPQNAQPPRQSYGHVNDERKTIFTDAVHFQPWVNEELNNILLNILCNADLP